MNENEPMAATARSTSGEGARPPGQWWGAFRMEEGSGGRWRIGPLEVLVRRPPHEWRIACESGANPFESRVEREIPADVGDLIDREDLDRFGMSQPGEEIRLAPALADRAIITRPDRPFHVPSEESLTIYVSSPLWIVISAGEPSRVLMDRPIHRPSDTWFGPVSEGGELCYANRAFCRLNLADLPVRPHRATTAIRVSNQAAGALAVERLKLPAPSLELRADSSGRLFTPDVVFVRRSGGEFASVEVSGERSWSTEKGVRLAGPRTRLSDNLIDRTFGTLFQNRQ